MNMDKQKFVVNLMLFFLVGLMFFLASLLPSNGYFLA